MCDALCARLEHSARATLILEQGAATVPDALELVGNLQRVEAAEIVVGYEFDLQQNTLRSERGPNPTAGRQHDFSVYRIRGQAEGAVELVQRGR